MEQIIESQIAKGIDPFTAVLNIIGESDPILSGFLIKDRDDIGKVPKYRYLGLLRRRLQKLGLSEAFINKWFYYPSGRALSTMPFVGEIPQADLSQEDVLLTNTDTTMKIKTGIGRKKKMEYNCT